jgi:hypothetical protein
VAVMKRAFRAAATAAAALAFCAGVELLSRRMRRRGRVENVVTPCSIAQVPAAAPVILDVTVAGPIEGRSFDIFAGVFAAGRPIRLRGLGEDHATLPDRLAQRGLFAAVLDRPV